MSRPSSPIPIVGTLVYLLVGPLVWAFHLTVIYGGSTLLCALGEGEAFAGVPLLVILATGASLALVVFAAMRPHVMRLVLRVRAVPAATESFLDRAMRMLAVLSMAGIVWAGATVALVAPCAQLR